VDSQILDRKMAVDMLVLGKKQPKSIE
jgi:hypothetical protein